MEFGEITGQWYEDCHRTVTDFAKVVGSTCHVKELRPADFEAYRRKLLRVGLSGRKPLGVYALDRSITVIKAVFGHAYELGLIDQPMRFGKTFTRSSATAKRRSRNQQVVQNGNRLFAPAEIRGMLDHAS